MTVDRKVVLKGKKWVVATAYSKADSKGKKKVSEKAATRVRWMAVMKAETKAERWGPTEADKLVARTVQ